MNSAYCVELTNGKKLFSGLDYKVLLRKLVSEKERISKIFFTLSTGDYLVLANFSKIYYYGESVKDIIGGSSEEKIEYLYLIIKKKNQYVQYKIRYNNSNIDVTIFDENSDYIKKLNPIGWRLGIEE